MSANESPEVPSCKGCGRTLIVRGEFTLCPTHDFVQESEINPDASAFVQQEVIILDGEKITNPFGISTRIIGIFDRTHNVRFEQQKREWYPEQYKDAA